MTLRDLGPVTYRWKKDEGEWMDSDSGQDYGPLNITNDKEGKKVKQFFCEVKNMFSVKQSRAMDNPFYKGMKFTPLCVEMDPLVLQD